MIYIAPMKALAQELVEKFSSKLSSLNLTVREYTGDMQSPDPKRNRRTFWSPHRKNGMS